MFKLSFILSMKIQFAVRFWWKLFHSLQSASAFYLTWEQSCAVAVEVVYAYALQSLHNEGRSTLFHALGPTKGTCLLFAWHHRAQPFFRVFLLRFSCSKCLEFQCKTVREWNLSVYKNVNEIWTHFVEQTRSVFTINKTVFVGSSVWLDKFLRAPMCQKHCYT